MIVTGLPKLDKEDHNEEDRKKVMAAVAKELGLDKNEFRKYVDKVHPGWTVCWRYMKW